MATLPIRPRPLGWITITLTLGGCIPPDKIWTPEETGGELQETSPVLDTSPEEEESRFCPPTLWFEDADRDGYGDSARPAGWHCDQPAGTAQQAGDCNEGDATVYPGAPEVCMDGRPNDCQDVDGSVAAESCSPDGPYSLAAADATLLGEFNADDSAYAGWEVLGVGDTNGDGFDDLLILQGFEPYHRLVLGPVSGDMSLADAQARIPGGPLIRPAGDMDLDGYPDLFAGLAEDVRSAWVLDGPFSGEVDYSGNPYLYSNYLYTFEDALYEDIDDNAAEIVSVPGDLNGDGWGDMVIGAPSYSGAFSESTEGGCPASDEDSPEGFEVGAAYFVYGPLTATSSLSSSDGLLIGESTGDRAGTLLEDVGDLDGDGLSDIFVNAPFQCEGGNWAGAAYVVLGPADGVRDLSEADMKLVGRPDLGMDMTISGAGDTNGDGYPDLLVGMQTYSGSALSQGRVYLILGPPGEDRSVAAADATWTGEQQSLIGRSISEAGDMDLDGNSDILIGADNYFYDETVEVGQEHRGAAALAYGPMSGTTTYSTMETAFIGHNILDMAGYSVSSAGDVDADGLPDLLVGAPYNDEAGDNAGAAYLILGGGVFFDGTYGP